MEEIAALLHRRPELALFAAILLGQIIGRIHVKVFSFGSVVGTMIAGILIGIFAAPPLPDLMRWVFFYLFLFSIGYSVGPQFFGSLRKEAIPQIVLSITLGVTGLITVVAVAIVLDFDEGTAVGLLSGGLTQSAALGTGLNAIAALPLPDDIKASMSGAAPLADAITYGFGDLGLILFLTVGAPLLLRINLKAEAKALENELAGGEAADSLFGGRFYAFRGYRVENPSLFGVTVDELEQRHAAGRLSVQRIRRDGTLLQVRPDTPIRHGDWIVAGGNRAAFVHAESEIGTESDDAELLAIPLKSANVVITNKAVIGLSIGEARADRYFSRGVYLDSITRGEQELPRSPGTRVQRGDVVHIIGSPQDVERAAAAGGFVERDSGKTDLTFLAAGIICGVLIGLYTIDIDNIPLGLGIAGGILVVGLIAGWARSRYPVFGSMPEAAQRVLADIGLTVFIAIVGLTAGPHAVEAYHTRGGIFFASIFFGGMIVTLVPPLVALLVGKFLLKINPLLLIAGIAGAQTCTPGLNALRDASGSNIVALGYTVPYAIGNIILTIWGPIVVAILQALRH
ncbi:aspartate:alanine exchanger family transporter [Noviherbaspirillum cavernae]|nr:TrkA C-terminal domain-containing protein [Noviherbaspirillum cavernae]